MYCELSIGSNVGNEVLKSVEFLKSNGVAEKVYTQKFPEKPFTWMAYVISVSVKSLGGVPVGVAARNEYDESESISIPRSILKLPICEANTLMIEIHRRIWDSVMKDQENLCKYCSKSFKCSIDLDKLDYSEEDKIKQQNDYHTSGLIANLSDGYTYVPFKTNTGMILHEEFANLTFNRFIYRVPTLEDAIRHEKDASNTVLFWRKIAADCLRNVQMVTDDGEVRDELPAEVMRYLGLKLYNSILSGSDLKEIRKVLREEMPTIQFFHKKDCPCEMKREIPVTMEATNFFSE